MSSEPQTTEDVPEDDTIVGRAIRVSLLLLAIGCLVVGVVLTLNRKPPEAAPEEGEQTDLPEVRDLPPLEVPELSLADITTQAGIDFLHTNGATGEKLLPETMGAGGAFLDFDSDGDQDILCVNSTIWPWADEQPDVAPTMALYENDGTGQFTNVTQGSGLDVSFYGTGVACGDYDNDGRVDIYISAVGRGRLFHNAGNGHFDNVTQAAGMSAAQESWGTSCGWFDYDNDGDLDLMVCNYLDWSRDRDLQIESTLTGTLRAYARPADFRGAFPVLYRNDGDGNFTDVSADSGIQVINSDTGEPLSKSLGLTFADINADGWLDVMIANDTVQNLLLLNQQDGTFAENGAGLGLAFDNNGRARGAMGIDAACFRNSDAIGFTIGNFANEMTALYVCQTPGLPMPIFRDEAVSNGIGPVTRTELTFGVMFADVDLDSRLDIIACNGHLEEEIQEVQSSQFYKQPPQLLWNCGLDYDSEFVVAPAEKTGADFAARMVGRGAARADIDGDGDLDLLLFAAGDRPRLLRNNQQTGHHWLRVKLVGRTCKDAIGATVRVTLPDETVLARTVMPTCSYQSQSELPLTFGLGSHEQVSSAEVVWADGSTADIAVPQVDTLLTIEQ